MIHGGGDFPSVLAAGLSIDGRNGMEMNGMQEWDAGCRNGMQDAGMKWK